MRRTIFTCLLAAVLVVLFVGAASAEQANVVTVHTVDELIAAVAPGAEIHLAEGEYMLSQAETYGQRSGNPYVKWEDAYGGFTLLIHDVDNLSIIGSGKDTTTLLTEFRDAEVLKFEDCTGIVVSGFTGGHTVQSEGCGAGVVQFTRCDNVAASDLGLFGCGAVGISAYRTTNMTVAECEIYECSSTGVTLSDCENVSFSDCIIRNIGKILDGYYSGYALVYVSSSTDVTFTGCNMMDSTLNYLFGIWGSTAVRMSDNRITGNSATSSMLFVTESEFIMEKNNVFEDNTFSHWYDNTTDWVETGRAVNELGEPMFTEDPEPLASSADYFKPTPVIAGEQQQIRVSTVDEFLAAIGSNTEIILTEKMYDLSTASDYGKPGFVSSNYYTWEEVYDGYQLVIFNVENLSIIGESGDAQSHTLAAVPRYANVLTFRSSSNVMLEGFTAGHTVEPGACIGGVLAFDGWSENILVDNCRLYGCGILGVSAATTTALQIMNCAIYECSDGGIHCSSCQGVTIGGCRFWDLGGPALQLNYCAGVTVNGKDLDGNYYGD